MDGFFMMKFLLLAALWMLIGAVLFGALIPENIDASCMIESVGIEPKLDAVTDTALHSLQRHGRRFFAAAKNAFGDCIGVEPLMKPLKEQLLETLIKLENFFWSRE